MLYHILNDDVSAHEVAVYFLELNAVGSKHLLYLNAVLIGLSFILQPADGIILLDSPQEIVKVVVAL